MADEVTSTQTSETTTETPSNEVDTTALGGAVETTTEGAQEQAEGETALGGKADEATAETTEAAAPVTPDTYELTAPDGVTLDAESVAAATPVFKELGLSNEQANKLVPVAAQFAERIQTQANQAILADVAKTRADWLATAKADPEIGGAKYDETIKTAAAALDGLGFVKGSPFRVLLDESGLGNHPDMIRAFFKVGQAIGDDGFVRTDTGGARKRTDAELFYGDNFNTGA